MTALEIELPAGVVQKVILRQPGDEALFHNVHAAEEEYKILQAAHSLGLPVPMPLYYDPSGKVFPNPYLVIEYIDGQPDFAPVNLADSIRQAAEHLARIHRADFSLVDLSFLPPHPKGLAETVETPPSQINWSMDEGHIRAALKTAWPIPQRNAPALLHGDYWPGNLLWRDEQLVAVIDWEDAALGDPLAELAISRLDIAWIFGREAMASFTNQYLAHNAIDTTYLSEWDLCAALRLIRLAGSDLAGWAAFFHPYGRIDITEETIREAFRYFIHRALGKFTV
jgi:aminoglycoside phosphotransferase (APT) family kinase protein